VSIHPLWVVFFATLSIIPALVVGFVFLFRFESLRGDVYKIDRDVDAELQAFTVKIGSITSANKTAIEALAEAEKARLTLISLEETVRSLSNKWNAREKSDRMAERRERLRKEEEGEEIPGTEQMLLPFPNNAAIPQQPGPTILPPKRKFGTVP